MQKSTWLGFILFCSCAAPPERTAGDLRFWLENMAWHHRYTAEEMAAATGLEAGEISRRLEEYGIREETRPPRPADALFVLPYPGGRHPRIGFLEGAVDPRRDTKFSVFLPGEGRGYVVVDLPEAVFSGRDLLYLAHTHSPTVWDKAGVTLERLDWTRRAGGVLESRRVLPNGVEFSARVAPARDRVDMELRLKNGSREKLAAPRTQICVLLKGAPEFNAQEKENKVRLSGEGVAAVRSREGGRWIAVVWERARTWDNPACPCIHSDPSFPDLAPGEEGTARGRLFFFDGEDLRAEVARRKGAGTLLSP